MAKKGRKKAKAKKKSPEEEKAEIVSILVAKCGKKEEEVKYHDHQQLCLIINR